MESEYNNEDDKENGRKNNGYNYANTIPFMDSDCEPSSTEYNCSSIDVDNMIAGQEDDEILNYCTQDDGEEYGLFDSADDNKDGDNDSENIQ